MCEHLEVEEITGVTVEYKKGSNKVIESHLWSGDHKSLSMTSSPH